MDRGFEGRSGPFGARAYVVLLACAGLALTLGVTALSATSALSFAEARSYAAEDFPHSVAIGDLNGDGPPDLVSTNSQTVSVLLNTGDGSFQAKRNYGTGNHPQAVAIGDLNGDGKPDLATANTGLGAGANTVSVLLNTGDGSFQAKRNYGTGNHPLAVAIGDLNGDGKPDLATANRGRAGAGVSVLLNRGDGSFQAKHDYGFGRNASSVAIGDLSGDGKPDLAVGNWGTRFSVVSVLVNRGDGSFRVKRDYATWSHSVAIGDLNGDGKPDLVAAGAAPTVSVFISKGDGSFRAKRDYPTAHYLDSVAIGDLNADGKPDLVTANGDVTSNVSVLLNKGDGSFQPKLDYGTGSAIRAPNWVGIGDLNGDGRPDLVTPNYYANAVSVLLNTPGLCAVQNAKGQTVPAAKRTIARVNCRVGKIRRAYSKTVRRGRVISQEPGPATVLPNGGKVTLLVSRGRKR
jgi:hypothetical protein